MLYLKAKGYATKGSKPQEANKNMPDKKDIKDVYEEK